MLTDDFSFDTDTGLFTAENTTTVIGEVCLLLTMKARSIKKNTAGKPEYSGDWFFDPSKGCNCFEIKTVSDSNLKTIENYVIQALKPLLNKGKIREAVVTTTRDINNVNRVNVFVDILQSDGSRIEYNHFYEVS